MRLTVSIPTYNRNETLLRNLEKLMPQMTADCKLHILDNCSDVPIEESMRPLLARFPDVACEIVRNRVNIGANANITRCHELCDSDWLWIIGDDDAAEPNAIQTIFAHIDAQPNAVLLNFPYDTVRQETFVTHGITEFAQKLDRSANLPWISNSVRRTAAMLPNVKFGYQYSFSLMPHVAILLMSIGETGECCFSPSQLVTVEIPDTPVEEQWSWLNLALGAPALFDLPLPAAAREQLMDKLLVTNYGPSIRMRSMVRELMVMNAKGSDPRDTLYMYDQIVRRSFYLGKGPGQRLSLALGRMKVRYPQLVQRLYKLVKKRELGQIQGQDRYERM